MSYVCLLLLRPEISQEMHPLPAPGISDLPLRSHMD